MPLSGPLGALLRPRFLVPLLAATLAGASAGWILPERYRAVAVVSVEGDPAAGRSLEDEVFARPHLEMLIAELDPYPATAGALERLRYDLAVHVSGPQTLALEYLHGDPQKAADVVNRLAGRLAERPGAPAATQADALDNRLAEARRELEEREAERRRFQEGHADTLPEQKEAIVATLERLRRERQALEVDLQQAQAESSAREEAAAASASSQPDVESQERERLRAELARLRDRYTEQHPDVRKLRTQLAELERRAPERTAPTPATPPGRGEALREQARALDALIIDTEARFEQSGRTEQQDVALSAELEAAKKRYLELLNQRMSAHLEKPGDQFRLPTLSFRVLTPAQPPERPFSPNRRGFLLGGLLLGLFSGLVLTFTAERRQEPPALEPARPAPPPTEPSSPRVHASFDVEFSDAPAKVATAEQDAAAPAAQTDELVPPDLLLDTAVIPAGPAAALPSSTTAPDLLEPGSIFWRTPRPGRTSALAEDAREPAPAVEPLPPEPAAPPAEDAPATILEPGSIFWHSPHNSATDTRPGRGRKRGPLLGDESEVVPREPPPSEPAAPVVEPPPPTVEPPPVEPPPGAPTPPRVEPPPVEPPPPVDEPLPTVALPNVPPPPAPAAVLSGPSLVVTGASREGVLALPASVSERLIGAAAYCHLRLDLPNVDPVHARVASDTYGLSLADAGSTAGTFVNGRRIAGRYPLKDGDLVSLGPPGSPQSASLLVHLPPVERAPVAREPVPPVVPREPQKPTDSAHALAQALIPPPPRTPPTPRPRVASPPPARPVELPPTRRRERRAGDRRGLAVAAALLTVLAGGVAAWNALLRSAPALAEVAPRRARPGQTLTLSGSGFGAAPEQNRVRVGSELARVVSASPNRLEVLLPRELGVRLPATLPVVVEVDGRHSSPLTVDVAAAPRVTGLQPEVARAGEAVTASLEPQTARAESVHVAGIAAVLVGSEPGRVRFTVPALAEASRVPVDVWIAGEPAERTYLAVGRLPLVVEVLPPRGPVGESVALRGFGFDPDPNGNRVRFGEAEALVLSSAPGELVVSAPSTEPGRAGHLELPISVEALGATSSSPAHYTLLGPPSGPFLPRFFAAPVPELPRQNHAMVSTELGPVMLLTGPAGEPSTAQRAARVARVLNELVEAAAKPLALAFEVEPVPAVTLAGGSYLVATATPADALGYEGLWARLGRRGRATPHSIATFWTALLQDYLSLFVQHQRPTHVLELSARGQVLADLYAQSVATPGGRKGVPTDLVSRQRRALVDAIREMALLLPQPGESNPGASVVGRWLGSMEEGDRGAQPIQVRLFFEGRRLAGSLTRRARGVTGEIRLRDVVYESSSLAFSLPAGAAALRFSGTVREDSMAGLISGGPDGRRTVGFFTLRFAE